MATFLLSRCCPRSLLHSHRSRNCPPDMLRPGPTGRHYHSGQLPSPGRTCPQGPLLCSEAHGLWAQPWQEQPPGCRHPPGLACRNWNVCCWSSAAAQDWEGSLQDEVSSLGEPRRSPCPGAPWVSHCSTWGTPSLLCCYHQIQSCFGSSPDKSAVNHWKNWRRRQS